MPQPSVKRIFHKPSALRPGDRVAVVAPAGPFDRESFEAGLAVLAGRYEVRYGEGLFAQYRYLAGHDTRRLAELSDALGDPAVRAVFCARGGYGTMRLLPRLGALQPLLTGSPKLLVGFSDITALHLWCQRSGLVSIHGPVVTQLGQQPAEVRARLFELLESPRPIADLTAAATLVPGVAQGPLLGGNLSVFTRLLGTPYLPSLEGAILLLEDLAERPYRLDRMWTHLALAGVFEKVRGIALGTFTGCEERDAAYTSVEVLEELARTTSLPCAAGFPIGHGELNQPVPLGALARLDATRGTLSFAEAVVR